MTDILLDTIAFDFLINNPDNIPESAQNLIENPRNNLFLSIVSIWEMSIQAAQQKITFAKPFQQAIHEELRKHDVKLIEWAFSFAKFDERCKRMMHFKH